MKHEVWLWLWFTMGCLVYWLKRAYYLVTGPNPVASNYKQFIERCWIPILVRWFVDSIMFWLAFTPGVADKAVNAIGWSSYAWVIQMITQFAAVAALFGLAVDSIVDFAVTKIPFIKDVVPQMPGPLVPCPPPATPPTPKP